MGGNLGGGKSLLEKWVKTYRDPSYSCAATTPGFQARSVAGRVGVPMWARPCLLPTSCV